MAQVRRAWLWFVALAHLVALLFGAPTHGQTTVQLTTTQWESLTELLNDIYGRIGTGNGTLAMIDGKLADVRTYTATTMTNLQDMHLKMAGLATSPLVRTGEFSAGGSENSIWKSLDLIRKDITGGTGMSTSGLLAMLAKSSERTAVSDGTVNTIWKNLDLIRVDMSGVLGHASSIDDGINGASGVRSRLATTNGHLSDLVGGVSSISSVLGTISSTLTGMSVNVASIAGVVTVDVPSMAAVLARMDEGIARWDRIYDAIVGTAATLSEEIAPRLTEWKSSWDAWNDPERAGYETWGQFSARFAALDGFIRSLADGPLETPHLGTPSVPSVTFTDPATSSWVSNEGGNLRDNITPLVSRVVTPTPGTPGPPLWSFHLPLASVTSVFGAGAIADQTVIVDFSIIPDTPRLAFHAFLICIVTMRAMAYVWEETRRYG